MAKEIYIHIGYPKTATTAIQYSLIKNHDVLNEHGYMYPTTGIPVPELGHHNLVWNLSLKTEHRKLFRKKFGSFPELKSEIEASSSNKVIISSEGFLRLFGKDCSRTLSYLDEVFQNHEIYYICAVREAADYIESLYLHSFKAWYANRFKGQISPYKQRIEFALKNPTDFLRPLRNLLKLRRGRVLLLQYSSNNIVREFYQLLSISYPQAIIQNKHRTNERLGGKMLSLIYLLGSNENWEANQKLFSENRDAVKEMFNVDQNRAYLFSSEQFCEVNRIFHNKISGDPDLSQFFDKSPSVALRDNQHLFYNYIFDQNELDVLRNDFGLLFARDALLGEV